jgi:hypothetical protein
MSTITTTTSSTQTTLITAEKGIPTHGKLRYITRGIIPTASPHLYHLPPLAEFADVRSLPITNIKPSLALGDKSPYQLHTHGFAARRNPSVLHSVPYTRESWNDETLLKNIYIPEVEALVKQLTGAKKIVTESALMRSCVHTEVDGLATSEEKKAEEDVEEDPFPKMIGVSPTPSLTGASPAPKVHLDFSPPGARIHLRKYHEKLAKAGKFVIEAEDKLLLSGMSPSEVSKQYAGPRWSMFSIWRPLRRVTRDPLALSDRRSFPVSDYIPVKLVEPNAKSLHETEGPTHETETYLAYGSNEHDWYWIWDMQPEEVLVIQLFDSEAEGKGVVGAGGVMHSSVEVEGTDGEEARESLEVRCTAFW